MKEFASRLKFCPHMLLFISCFCVISCPFYKCSPVYIYIVCVLPDVFVSSSCFVACPMSSHVFPWCVSAFVSGFIHHIFCDFYFALLGFVLLLLLVEFALLVGISAIFFCRCPHRLTRYKIRG